MDLRTDRQVDNAITEYETLIKIAPERNDFYHRLGQVYLAQGSINDALTELERALARDADFRPHYTIGIAYKQLSKNTAAAKHLYEAGLLAFIDGDNTTALNAYRALEEIGPERIVRGVTGDARTTSGR